MNNAFGKTPAMSSTIGLSQIAAAQFLACAYERHWIKTARQAGPLGWTIPARWAWSRPTPNAHGGGAVRDYDFSVHDRELAVGAQFKLPYLHIVVNNALSWPDPPSQRGFDMDYCVQLAFDNVTRRRAEGYRMAHVAWSKASRSDPACRQEEIAPAIEQARKWMDEYRVPVVVEIMLEASHQYRDGHRDQRDQ